MGLFGTFYGEKVPMIIMECLVLLAGICLIIRSVYRHRKDKKKKAAVQKEIDAALKKLNENNKKMEADLASGASSPPRVGQGKSLPTRRGSSCLNIPPEPMDHRP